MATLHVKTNVESDGSLSAEHANMLAMLAHIQGLVDIFKQMGMPVDEAAERAGAAVRAAWDIGRTE